MPATLGTVDAILKEVYEGQINDQLNEERILIKRLERTSDNVTDNIGGKYVVFPVRSGRNVGISYRGEDSQLAPAGNQQYKAAQEQLKYGYGRVGFTGQMMRLARTNPQAFSNALEEEMDGLKTDIGKDENRIAWGHPDQGALGHTGILAKLTTSPAGAPTFTVDNAQWLEVGMKVEIWNSTGPALVQAMFTINGINRTTNVVTASGNVTATSGQYVARFGNYNREPYGLCNIVSATGPLHNLNPATAGQEFWASEIDSTTTTLTELAMIQMGDKIRQKGGSIISAVFASLGVRRAYWNILVNMRRYNEPKQFNGGLTGLSFMFGGKDLPVVEDPDAPFKTMAFVTESELKIFRDKDWYWEDLDGSIYKWVYDYDKWEALMKQYWQMGTHKRNAHGRFTNITES